jgi:hypothetical protein
MQHGVEALHAASSRGRFVVPARGRWTGRIARGRPFRTVSGPTPSLARTARSQPVVAVRAAARRLGRIGSLPAEHERPVAALSRMRWSPPRAGLRDHRRRSASPWRG